MFKDLEGDMVFVRKGGVYKLVPLVVKNTGELFAKVGSNAYVRIYENGGTTQPGLMVTEMHTDIELFKDSHGRLTVDSAKGKALDADKRQRLMLGSD